MKRFITLLLVALAATFSLSAHTAMDDPASAQTETKTYSLSHFTGLDISSVFDVELTQASRFYVSVEAPDFIVPYLRVEKRDDRLVLALSELPRDVNRRLGRGNYRISARVSMPDLYSLRMSGASKLQSEGEFGSNKSFTLRLSGASVLRSLSIRATEARINSSGASKFELRGAFSAIDAELSGSSRGRLDADAKEVQAQLSGASNLTSEGSFSTLDVTCSGASNYIQRGEAGSLTLAGSGASSLNLREAPASSAEIHLNSAAKADVDVRGPMRIELSGAASLRYRNSERTRIESQSISRASSISSY